MAAAIPAPTAHLWADAKGLRSRRAPLETGNHDLYSQVRTKITTYSCPNAGDFANTVDYNISSEVTVLLYSLRRISADNPYATVNGHYTQ